jgi:hypothetical protein
MQKFFRKSSALVEVGKKSRRQLPAALSLPRLWGGAATGVERRI